MTLPTTTYGVGWQDDFGDKTNYETGGTAPPTLTVVSNTLFNIEYDGNSGYVSNKDSAHLDISSTLYPKVVFRYKTSNANVRTRVQVVFSDGSNEYVTGVIGSTTWVTVTASISTTGKTIDHIRLYVLTAAGNVYFDFASLYMGTQTFHNYDLLDVNPRVKSPLIGIPGRDTDVTQMLGRTNTIITIEGPMRSGKTWGGSNLTYGEFLMRLLAEKKFQWFTSDQGCFKVTPVPEGFHFRQSKDSDYQLHYSLVLREYDVGDASVFGSPGWYGK